MHPCHPASIIDPRVKSCQAPRPHRLARPESFLWCGGLQSGPRVWLASPPRDINAQSCILHDMILPHRGVGSAVACLPSAITIVVVPYILKSHAAMHSRQRRSSASAVSHAGKCARSLAAGKVTLSVFERIRSHQKAHDLVPRTIEPFLAPREPTRALYAAGSSRDACCHASCRRSRRGPSHSTKASCRLASSHGWETSVRRRIELAIACLPLLRPLIGLPVPMWTHLHEQMLRGLFCRGSPCLWVDRLPQWAPGDPYSASTKLHTRDPDSVPKHSAQFTAISSAWRVGQPPRGLTQI